MALGDKILIFYALIDDQPSTEEESGWIAKFHHFLEVMLNQIMESSPEIRCVSEKDIISDIEIAKCISLVILSPNFVKSSQCLALAERINGVKQNNLSDQLFNVIKSPTAHNFMEPKVGTLPFYNLFYTDPKTGEVIEYEHLSETAAKKNYWMNLVDLSYDILNTCNNYKHNISTPAKTIFSEKNIYLAETAHDLSVERAVLKRELQRKGYTVLPDQQLPQDDIRELEKIIKKGLKGCEMSIHLIGSVYGHIPKGSDRSIVDLQNKIAAEVVSELDRQQEPIFSRLIWVSPNIHNTTDQQQTFISAIKRDIPSMIGAEIIETPLEDFKNVIREELKTISTDKRSLQESLINKPSEVLKEVYLIYEKVDSGSVKPLIHSLSVEGLKITIPTFQGNLQTLRQKHIENLNNADAAIIFREKINDQWVKMKVLDLFKAPGFGRGAAIPVKVIVSGNGTPPNKTGAMHDKVTHFNWNESKPKELIHKFVSMLK